MVLFNYSTRELTAKIVYYGPGLCGKTTNLQFIYEQLPEDVKGKMLSLATKTDRTLFFDFLPMDLGEIRGMKTRVQLYTVPGQVFYNETRKLVLKGADGVVFVADSQEQMMSSNVESLRNLEENLKAHGMKLADIPHVIQFNKRDLPRLASSDELNANLNKYNAPTFDAVATTGVGVQDTLKGIARLVLVNLTRRYQPKAGGADKPAAAPAPAPAAEPVAAAPAPKAAAAKPAAEAPRPAPIPVAAPVKPAPAPAPVLVGAAPAAAARVEPASSSFAEVDVDEMMVGLREAEVEESFDSEPAWGETSDIPTPGKGFDDDRDGGFFLGETDAESSIRGAAGKSIAERFSEQAVPAPRLTVGETREIVVPVELQDGKRVKRFRLSVTLRLDPAD